MGKEATLVADTADALRTTGPRGSGAEKRGSRWSRVHSKINHSADNFFHRLGYWVATHPKLTVGITLVLVVACCFGFTNFEMESDSDDLWVPSDSLSKDQEKIVLQYFDDDGKYAVLLIEAPSEGDSVLTKESLDAVWEIDALVLSIETDGQTYTDLCTKDLDGVTCNQPFRGITRFWGNSFETYEASVSTDADILADVNVKNFPDGQEVNLEAIFGNTATYDSSGALTSARAMLQTYELMSSADEDAAINDVVHDWEADFQDLMADEADSFSSVFNVFYLTSRSIDDGLEESVYGETYLFVITFVVMTTFVMAVLGRCCSGPVLRRSWLGVGGVGVVAAAGLAAYGLNSAFAVPFTSLAMILPFILIGIGVDDMLIIVAAFDLTDPTLPVEERIALGLKRCGVSITYTSLTSFFAFMLGSATSLPAVKFFCLYAGTAILFNFFFQMTTFVAFLTMDVNRQKAGKMDWCCCFTNKRFLEEEEVQRGVVLPPHGSSAVGQSAPEHGTSEETHQLTGMAKFIKEKYTPSILSPKGKVVVLLGSAALLAAGLYGVTQSTEDFDVLDLAPDDHYSRDYTELARTYELEIDAQYLPLGVYTQDVDYPDVSVQEQIQATEEALEEQTFIEGPLESWLASFVTWAANSTDYSANVGTSGGYSVYTDRDTFYTALAEFTEDGDYARFQSDIVYNDAGEIEMSRSYLYLIDLTNTANSVDALEQTRDVVDESTLDPQPFGYSGMFVFIEQFLVIYDELIMNFILALVAVAILSLLVLGKVFIVILICLTVIVIDAELLGFVYHWGLDVNSITVIELIMAVGLVVDYMVHIVHYFLHQDPNTPKDARIADALVEIGPSVMLGATTTFLGVMPLAFANNVVFRVFFKMFIVIISFGFYHGVVFIPVALSLLPDRAVSKHPTSASSNESKATPMTVRRVRRVDSA